MAVFDRLSDSVFSSRAGLKNDEVKVCLVIPNTGCPGCISGAEQLMLDMLKGKYKVRFVLTNIVSFKNLRLKLGDSIVNNPNVYIDRGNIFLNNTDRDKSIYPLLLYVSPSSHRYTSHEYMMPENPDAIKHLYQYLGGKP